MTRYHAALTKEIKQFVEQESPKTELFKKDPLKTIFFGGGTPSTYPDDLLLDMFGILERLFVVNRDTEISLEVNPGTVRPEQLELWKRLGINRLSIGVQSLNNAVLRNLNRHQSAQDVAAVLRDAKDLIPNLSIDLIIGLPGISEQEWKELVRAVVQWPIKHISIYFLTIHEGTALFFRVKKNEVVLPPDEAVVDLYIWTVAFLAEHGFEQYEISNFAREGYYARHNQVYWARTPYKAFGVGACSFDGAFRYQNNKNIMQYLDAMEQGHDSNDFTEQLTEEQVFLEKVMLGLRQSTGIKTSMIFDYSAPHKKEKIMGAIEEMEQVGYLKRMDETIRLTPLGLAVENEVVVTLSQ
jgi:oxygen-independent coproporphyrinogen-3 oxidase